MAEPSLSEFLVLSRGKWDPAIPPETIQQAIDDFYLWIERHIEAGRMKPGQRLARDGRLITKQLHVDGPFAETKEVIGGYWFIRAASLDEAALLAAENPCLQCGLSYEIRPIETERASAYAVTNETPSM